MSLLGFLFELFGSDSDDNETKKSSEHGHHGHHGDRGPSEERRHYHGPAASDSVRHGAVEAESYSRKAEIKNEVAAEAAANKAKKK